MFPRHFQPLRSHERMAGVRFSLAEAIKIRKKDIKEAKKPDVVLTHATSLFDWLVDRRNIVLGVVAGFVVVAGGAGWVSASSKEKRQIEGAQLSQAIEKTGWIVLEGGTDRAFPNEEAKQAAVGEALASVKALGGDAGRTASLKLASIALDQGEVDTAISGFESFLSNSNDPALRLVALEGVASAYEAKKDFARARETWVKLGETAPARALFHQARIYEQEGDKAKARELYQQVVAEHESKPAAIDARMRLDLLGAPAPGVGAF